MTLAPSSCGGGVSDMVGVGGMKFDLGGAIGCLKNDPRDFMFFDVWLIVLFDLSSSLCLFSF